MSDQSSIQRSGTVAIIGRPNVGKSTLLNALVGMKVSIVSRKAQTTRHRIHGILTTDSAQFVFVDTPGYQTRHGGNLNRGMNRVVTQALADVDVIVMVIECGKFNDGDKQLLPLLQGRQKSAKTVLALTKTDLVQDKATLFGFTQSLMEQFAFDEVVPVSSKRKFQLDVLLKAIETGLPEGEAIYEADMFTDRSERFMASEIIREKVFRLLGDELPYGCTVVVDQFETTGTLRKLAATIVVASDSHKPILIGERGLKLKRIGTEAREDLQKLFDSRVHLDLWVKVRENWADDVRALREFGYE